MLRRTSAAVSRRTTGSDGGAVSNSDAATRAGVSGVRNSWLRTARKSSLARFAASAASRARANSRSASLRAVMSRAIFAAPTIEPFCIAHRRNGHRHFEHTPVLRHAHCFVVVDDFALAKTPQELNLLMLPVRGYDPRNRLTDHLLGRVTEKPLCARVPARHDAFESLANDRVRRRIHDRGQPIACGFRTVEVCDIASETARVDEFAVLPIHARIDEHVA